MSRILLFAALLPAAGSVPADEVPQAGSVAGATEAQVRDEVPDGESAAGANEAQARDEVPEAGQAAGAAETQSQTQEGPKVVSGMSVLGNQEAPKSLVIVPWKSSQLGDSLGISPLLDDSRQPVDKDVFMRALSYYEIRSESTP